MEVKNEEKKEDIVGKMSFVSFGLKSTDYLNIMIINHNLINNAIQPALMTSKEKNHKSLGHQCPTDCKTKELN